MPEPLTVKIYVEGGVVQDISLPPGVKALVFDYDVNDDSDIQLDERGDECTVSVWESEADLESHADCLDCDADK